jgi:hypothetical protein
VNPERSRRDQKIFFDHEQQFDRAERSRNKFATKRENQRSRMMASRADLRDRAIGAKFRAHRARSIAREISLAIRAHSGEIFSALVLFTK